MFKKIRLYLLLAICCAGEVYLLIPGGYDVLHGGVRHTFLGLLGLFFLFLCVVFLIWCIFFKKEKVRKSELQNKENELEDATKISAKRKNNYIAMLDELPNQKEFKKDIEISKKQIERFETYLFNIQNICMNLNDKSKVNFAESERTIHGAIGIFYSRVESMIACIRIFDSDEYHAFRKGELELKSQESIREKEALFERTFQYVDEVTDSNEELILAVHKLLSTLTEMSLSKGWDTETILATKRLNDYIKKTEGVVELNSLVGKDMMEYFQGTSGIVMPEDRK